MGEEAEPQGIPIDDSLKRVYSELASDPTLVDALDDPFTRSGLIDTLKGTASVKLENLGWFIRRPEGTWQGMGGIYKPDTALGKKIEFALEEKRRNI